MCTLFRGNTAVMIGRKNYTFYVEKNLAAKFARGEKNTTNM